MRKRRASHTYSLTRRMTATSIIFSILRERDKLKISAEVEVIYLLSRYFRRRIISYLETAEGYPGKVPILFHTGTGPMTVCYEN